MVGHPVYHQHPSAPAAHKVGTLDVLDRLFAAFDQHVRPNGLDQWFGGVLIEEANLIDAGEACQHRRAGRFRLHRMRSPFEAAHAGIAVQADNEAVTPSASLLEEMD